MTRYLIILGLLSGAEIHGGSEIYPDKQEEMSGGVASGLLGLQVCTQDADDTTPGVGVGYGPLGRGCNIIYTNDANTGATAITTFDGIPPTIPGTPGSVLYVVGPATAANPTTISDAGNFALEYDWSAAGSGEETRVLALGCIVADTFFEITRHNGIRFFNDDMILIDGAVLQEAAGTKISFPADGQVLITNAAGTDFDKIMFGGTTNAFPALERSSTQIAVKKADGSSFGAFNAGSITCTTGNIVAADGGEIRLTVTKGAISARDLDQESVTFAGGGGDAFKDTTGNPLCDGCTIGSVTSRVTTAGTGCAGFHLGTPGDSNLFGADLAVTLGSTSDGSDFTANISSPVLEDTQIRVTGTDGGGVPANCIGLVVRITTHYKYYSADTTN